EDQTCVRADADRVAEHGVVPVEHHLKLAPAVAEHVAANPDSKNQQADGCCDVLLLHCWLRWIDHRHTEVACGADPSWPAFDFAVLCASVTLCFKPPFTLPAGAPPVWPASACRPRSRRSRARPGCACPCWDASAAARRAFCCPVRSG